MDSLLIGLLVVAAAVVYFVVEPLVSGLSAPSGRDEDEPSEEDYRKRAVLLALRDVEYDYHTGKLDEPDYRALRAQLSREALAALKATGAAHGAEDLELRDGDALEEEIRRLRGAIREGPSCPQCGLPTALEARFCGACGSEIPSVTSPEGTETSEAPGPDG